MFEWCSMRGDEDLVAGADVRAAPRLRDEVDRLGRAAREDDLLLVARVDEALHRRARLLVRVGGRLAEVVHAAMDVRVLLGVVADDARRSPPRLLRRGGVVEIDERLAVRPCCARIGKSRADRARRRRPAMRAAGDVTACSSRSLLSRSGRRSGMRAEQRAADVLADDSIFIRSTISLANAYDSRLRASSSPMPRERR